MPQVDDQSSAQGALHVSHQIHDESDSFRSDQHRENKVETRLGLHQDSDVKTGLEWNPLSNSSPLQQKLINLQSTKVVANSDQKSHMKSNLDRLLYENEPGTQRDSVYSKENFLSTQANLLTTNREETPRFTPRTTVTPINSIVPVDSNGLPVDTPPKPQKKKPITQIHVNKDITLSIDMYKDIHQYIASSIEPPPRIS